MAVYIRNMARKTRQIISAEYTRGFLAAAELADGYNGVSLHPLMLGDCILAKVGIIPKRAIRKNPAAARRSVTISRVMERSWGPGDAYHVVEAQVDGIESLSKSGQAVRVIVEPHVER